MSRKRRRRLVELFFVLSTTGSEGWKRKIMISSLKLATASCFLSLSPDGALDGVRLFSYFSFCCFTVFFRSLSLSFSTLSQRFLPKTTLSRSTLQLGFPPSLSGLSPLLQTSAAGLETAGPGADAEESGEREEEEGPFPAPFPSPKHRAAKAATASATSAGFSS